MWPIMRPTEQAGTAPENAPHLRWNKVLRALREARGVTLDGWGARLGVSRRTVQRWERGERPPDPGAEAAIIAFCREAALFRSYDRGPLAGLILSAELLQDLLTEARLGSGSDGNRQSAIGNRAPSTQDTGRRTQDSTQSSNLPAELTSFIGREHEIAVLRRLQARTRLLTLTGTGGVGKTRLALEMGRELLWAYPHGVWLAELAALADPTLAPQTVAAALGLQPAGSRSPTDDLKEFLRERHLLLVLDNCEHLLTACAHLAETLLRACPTLAVLATSREPLGVPGETLYRVPPMTVPSSEFRVPSEVGANSEPGTRNSELEQADSVRLFMERARLHRPEFALTERNAAVVTELCLRLDGIPLAIELAAARVKVLSVDQLAARIEDRFQVLTGGSRTALPRHQTMRAALDWSHALLTAEEQALLRCLSVFAGGFTLEAAEAVTDLPPRTPSLKGWWRLTQPSADQESPIPSGRGSGGVGHDIDTLDLLTSLVDKSLVVAEEQQEGVRYRLLETIRQYAAEKLDAAGEAAEVRERHHDWCMALAEVAEPELHGPHVVAWLARLEREHDNLRAALAWSLTGSAERSLQSTVAGAQAPDRRGLGKGNQPAVSAHDGAGWDRTGSPSQTESGLQLASTLTRFWEMRGHASEGRRWLAQALSVEGMASAAVRARVLCDAGILAAVQGDFAAADALSQESLLLSRDLGDDNGMARAELNLGSLAHRRGDYAIARPLLEASLARSATRGNRPATATAYASLAQIALRQGDYTRARAGLEASLAIQRELGNKHGIAGVLDDIATVAGEQGDEERQTTALAESLALFRELGHKGGIALVLGDYGMLAWLRREYERAAALLQESLTLYREVGERANIARLLGYHSLVALFERDYTRAAAFSRECLTLYREAVDPWAIGRYLPVLAGALLGQGQPERAASLFATASAVRERLGAPLPLAVRSSHDRTVAALRESLGERSFTAAWRAGETMTLDDALDDALR